MKSLSIRMWLYERTGTWWWYSTSVLLMIVAQENRINRQYTRKHDVRSDLQRRTGRHLSRFGRYVVETTVFCKHTFWSSGQ